MLALYQVALCAINLSIDSSCNELILGTTCLFIELIKWYLSIHYSILCSEPTIKFQRCL